MEINFWREIADCWIIVQDPEALIRNSETASIIAETFKSSGEKYKTISEELAEYNAGDDELGWRD